MSVRNKFPPIFLAFSLLLIYLGTIAPGLTWANNGADGGDLITAAATGGIPHPTGYPVYMLLARFFLFLPLGSLAFGTNLLSTLSAVLAAVLVYGILVWPPNSPVYRNWMAGLIAGFSFGLSPLLWSQAVITEVYTLHTLLTAMVIFLALWVPLVPSLTRLERWSGLVLGLAIGNHLTSIFLIPSVLLANARESGWKINWKVLTRILAWLSVGLLVYLILPIRALSDPPVNWGNPVTFRQFIWLITGELYQDRLVNITSVVILERVRSLVIFLLQQFELHGLMLALIGLVYFFRPSRLYFITIFNALIFSTFAVLYASFDWYVYLLPVILSVSIWIGLGIGGLLQSIVNYSNGIKIVLSLLFFILFIALTTSRWPQVDASHDLRAEQFGSHAMKILPQNAIVFADGDQAIFTLWYFHFALKQRADIAILVPELLRMDWYVDELRITYPSVRWPNGIIWPPTIAAANLGRSICYISYFTEEKISCSAVP